MLGYAGKAVQRDSTSLLCLPVRCHRRRGQFSRNHAKPLLGKLCDQGLLQGIREFPAIKFKVEINRTMHAAREARSPQHQVRLLCEIAIDVHNLFRAVSVAIGHGNCREPTCLFDGHRRVAFAQDHDIGNHFRSGVLGEGPGRQPHSREQFGLFCQMPPDAIIQFVERIARSDKCDETARPCELQTSHKVIIVNRCFEVFRFELRVVYRVIAKRRI